MPDTSAVVKTKPAARKKSARKRLYELHSWLGFHLAALMALVLATGTIATISHEIDWVFQHDMRVVPDDEQVSWGTMYDAVNAHRPNSTILSLFEMEGDHFAYRARVMDEFGRHDFIHVNQWTGEITGETHPLTVQRVFRDLHRYLFMPNFIGLPIVTSLAFVLALSLYTGLKTTRNWRTLLFRVRTNKGARIMWGDAHKAAGLWAIWFFVVMIVTGVWYLIEFGAAAANTSLQAPRANVTVERVAEMGEVIPVPDVDRIIAITAEAYPELKPTQIFFPTSARASIEVQGSVGNPIIRPRANRVFLDPADLSVVKVQKSRQISWGQYLNEMADPLHFGFFGGLPTKLIWFVFGIMMTGLSVTGVWLTWKRLKTAHPSKAQYATLPVLVLSMFFATWWYGRIQGPAVPAQQVFTNELQDGAIQARLGIAQTAEGEYTGLIRLEVGASGDRPNLKHAALSVHGVSNDEPVLKEQRARALGRVTEFRFNVPIDDLSTASMIATELTFQSGQTKVFQWTSFKPTT